MIRAFSHIAVGVRDMEASLRFYRDVVGLDVGRDAIERFPTMGDVPAHSRRGVYLRWAGGPDQSHVVLDEQPRRRDLPPRDLSDLGYHHFGFWVESVDEIYARAVAAGGEVVIAPCDNDSLLYGEPAGGLIRTTVLRDPDGNLMQFDQRITCYAAA